jgi:hypothetical protein
MHNSELRTHFDAREHFDKLRELYRKREILESMISILENYSECESFTSRAPGRCGPAMVRSGGRHAHRKR